MKRTLLILLMLTACKMGPDYTVPETYVDEGWHAGALADTLAGEPAAEWWKGFNDPLLNGIIAETASHNHDVRAAVARVEEARALRAESNSGLFPSLGADAGARREGTSSRTGNSTTSGGRRDNFDAGLDAAWELDLFGRVRRATEAADARLEEQEELRHEVLLSVLGEAARNYFEVRGLQKRIDVTKRSIELVRAVEDLAETQLRAGAVTEFDVARARGERETIEAQLPGLEAQMQAGIYRISVLAGKPPEHYLEALSKAEPLPEVEDKVPVGLRSDLLRRRPDIRAAERALAAANADIGVAVADRFPQFALTGDVGTAAGHFGDLFAAGASTYGVAALLHWPVFEGGALKARVKAAEARKDVAEAEYDKAVLTALEDTEGSLMRYGAEWRTLRQLQAAEKTRREGFNIAKLRYEAGEENFLTLLDAERSLITAQDTLTQSETRILTSLTQLYKALGGGWGSFDAGDPQPQTTP